jgi:hypothetical protein
MEHHEQQAGSQPDLKRRSFLKAAPLGALAATAPAPTTAPAAPPHSGYHETEHIRHYYRTAAYW